MHLDETGPRVPIAILAWPSRGGGSGRLESGRLTENRRGGKPKVEKCSVLRPATAAGLAARIGGNPPPEWGPACRHPSLTNRRQVAIFGTLCREGRVDSLPE